MKKFALGLVFLALTLASNAEAVSLENNNATHCCCYTIYIGIGVGFLGVSTGVYTFCCYDNYYNVTCGRAIIQNADAAGLYQYGGLTIEPSSGKFQIQGLADIQKQEQGVIANSGLSPDDQAALSQKPLVVTVKTATEIVFDDLSNPLLIMPGDYTVDNNGVVNFNIGVVVK